MPRFPDAHDAAGSCDELNSRTESHASAHYPIKKKQQPYAQLQGSITQQFEAVHGPSAWVASDYNDDTAAWNYRLNEAEVDELGAAVSAVICSGSILKDVTRDDVRLPVLGTHLLAIRNEIIQGRGFQVIKGVPVWRYSRQEALTAYWIIGLWFGKAVSNNKQGHLIGHIKDLGHDPKNPTTRLYATSAAQPFHNDSADIVGLLCLANAKEGGDSRWSSSVSVHNHIVKHAPQLARELGRRDIWYFDRKGEIPHRSNGLGYFELPVFNYHKGYLSTNYSPNYYFAAQRHPGVPTLTQAQQDAIELFDTAAASPSYAGWGGRMPRPVRCAGTSGSNQPFYDVALRPELCTLENSRSEMLCLIDVQAQREAIELYDTVAASPELCMRGRLEAGDIQLLNNHTCLHARDGFVDHSKADEKRHLLRLWLSPDDDRPLPPYYAELLGGSVEIGHRGGIQVQGAKLCITEEAK